MRNLGKVVMTNGIRKALADFPSMHFVIQDILEKFKANDWGILCKEDAEVNFMALEQQEQVLGAYHSPVGEIWLMTDFYPRGSYIKLYGEPESQDELLPVTTVLFPSEH